MKTIDEKIFALRSEVEENIRQELQQLLRTLRDVGYPEGVLDIMMRLGLRLTTLIYHSAEVNPPSDNLFDRVTEATKKKILPEEMAVYFHLIRILSNKPHHDAEKIKLQITDAENVLSGFLRLLEWYYCEFAMGPKLNSIYLEGLTIPVTFTQMLETFYMAQRTSEEKVRQLQSELEKLKRLQIEYDRRRRNLSERVVGDVRGDIISHFKDRWHELISLRKFLCDENLRVLIISGRSGIGKTALITKLIHEIQSNFKIKFDKKIFDIDSVIFISLRQSEMRHLDKIIELICRTLDRDEAKRLKSLWQQRASFAYKIENLLRSWLKEYKCLLVLDNFEDLLDDENMIQEDYKDLRFFIEKILEYDHNFRLIITSRRAFLLSPEKEADVVDRKRELSLEEGLPEKDAIALLRELDSDGSLGLRDGSEEILSEVVKSCRGIPRTLEILAGTLKHRRTWNIKTLLVNKKVLQNLIENPSRELYESLYPKERLVMQAISIYDSPVPLTAISYLLPGLDVDEIINSLVRNHAVYYDQDKFFLHPLDAQYAYRQIPEGEGLYTKQSLHCKAAEFYHQMRKPISEWKSIEDLEPQLKEFHHLVKGGRYDQACAIINEIDRDYLSLWGYFGLIVELRTMLIDKLVRPDLQIDNWSYLGSAFESLGDIEKTINCCHKALEIANTSGDLKRASRILNLLGIAYHDLGEFDKAAKYYEESLEIDKTIGDKRGEAVVLGNLGLVFYELGEPEKSIEYNQQALIIDREIGDKEGEGADLCNLGHAYHALGEYEKALEMFKEAYAIAEKIGDKINLSYILYDSARIHHRLCNLKEARAYYEKGVLLDMPEVRYRCSILLGILCLEEGSREEAIKYLNQGLAQCEELLKKTPHFYDALYFLALAQLAKGESEKSIENYYKAISICSSRGIVQNALINLHLLLRAKPYCLNLKEVINLLEKTLI